MYLKTLKFYSYSLIVIVSLLGCGKRRIIQSDHSTSVVVHPGFSLVAIGKWSVDAIPKRYMPPFRETMPKLIVPKFKNVNAQYFRYCAFNTGDGFITYAQTHRNGPLKFWACSKGWQNRKNIANLPVVYFDDMDMEWDNATKHLILLVNNRDVITGARNGFTVGFVSCKSPSFRQLFNQPRGEATACIAGGSIYVFEMCYNPNSLTIYSINLRSHPTKILYRESNRLRGHEAPMLIIPSPDGHTIAFDRLNPYANDGCGIWLINTLTSTCQQVSFGNHAHYYHNLLGWESSNELYFYDVYNSTVYQLTLPKAGPFRA